MNDIRLYITLGATPMATQAVMDRLRLVLARWDWGSAGSRTDALLVIQELIDDCRDHAGPDPTISLELARCGQRLRIEVTDTTLGRRPRSLDAADGHELHAVRTIAARWGSSKHPHGGATVWCELINIPEPRRPVPAETLDIAA